MNFHEEHEGRDALAEAWLVEAAASFDYPPTPDVSRQVRQRLARPRPVVAGGRRRLAWAAVALLLLLASLLAVPQVRAALREILGIGAMTIIVDEGAGPQVEPAVTATPGPDLTPSAAAAQPRATAGATPAEGALVVPATPVSLAAAREMVGERLRRPAYPEEIGAPDGVYVDRRERPGVVVFVWEKAGRPGVRLSLYQIYGTNFGMKAARQVAETTVNGRRALWIEGPHMFQQADGSLQPWQFVSGPVLLWTEGAVTYRLEGATSLDEAVRIAESLARFDE